MFDDSIAIAVRPAESCQDLFKKAQAAATPTDRIDGYRRVVNLCPDDSMAVQAAFMVGFTYAEELEQYDRARAEFKAFLAKYPNSELAKSASWMMENMDKPAPELKDAPEGTGSTGAPPDSTR
jgi:TolA-binding protein